MTIKKTGRQQCGSIEPELPGILPASEFTAAQLARREARIKKLVAVFAAARLERRER